MSTLILSVIKDSQKQRIIKQEKETNVLIFVLHSLVLPERDDALQHGQHGKTWPSALDPLPCNTSFHTAHQGRMWKSLCKRYYILTALILWTMRWKRIPAISDLRERGRTTFPGAWRIILEAGPSSKFPYSSHPQWKSHPSGLGAGELLLAVLVLGLTIGQLKFIFSGDANPS